jgi:hypothetical protein
VTTSCQPSGTVREKAPFSLVMRAAVLVGASAVAVLDVGVSMGGGVVACVLAAGVVSSALAVGASLVLVCAGVRSPDADVAIASCSAGVLLPQPASNHTPSSMPAIIRIIMQFLPDALFLTILL